MKITEMDFREEFLSRFGDKEKQYILDFCNTFLITFPNVLDKQELLNKINRLKSFKVWDGNSEVEGHYLKNKETGLTTYDDMCIIYREGLEARDERNTCYHELLHLISYKGQTQAPVWGEETYECGLWMLGLQFPDEKDGDQWFEEKSDLDEIMNEFYAVKMLETEGRYRRSKFIVKEATKTENEVSVTYNGNGYGERVYLAEIYDEIFKDDLLKAKLIDRRIISEKFNQKFKNLQIDIDDICINIPAFSKIGMQISEHLGKAQQTALNIWKQNLKEKTQIEEFDLYEYLKTSGKVKSALPHVESKNKTMRGKINSETLSWLNEQIDELDEKVIIQQLRPDLVGEQTEPEKAIQKKQFLAVINTLRDNIEGLTREDIEKVSYGEMSSYNHSNLSCLVLNAGEKSFMAFASEEGYMGSSEFKTLPEEQTIQLFSDAREVECATVPTPRHIWSIVKNKNGFIPLTDNPNLEYVSLDNEILLNGEPIAKENKGRNGPGMAQEYGLSESQREEKGIDTRLREDKISIENIKATRKAREPEISEVRTENKKLSDNITNSRSFAQSLRNKTLEERKALENARRQRMAQNGEQIKRNASGQSR